MCTQRLWVFRCSFAHPAPITPAFSRLGGIFSGRKKLLEPFGYQNSKSSSSNSPKRLNVAQQAIILQ